MKIMIHDAIQEPTTTWKHSGQKILNHIHKAVFIKEKTFLGFIIIKHQKTLYANSGYQYILRQYIFQRGNEKESRDFPERSTVQISTIKD